MTITNKDIFIDVETYSSVDLKSCGSYKYIASPDFEILIIGYAIGYGPVITVDLARGDKMPDELIQALTDSSVRKHAHNAIFERNCFRRIGYDIPIDQWHCTLVKSAYCGLPLSLDQVSKVLDLKNKKQSTGTLLINYFSKPCKPTKINNNRTRNYPDDAPEKWEMYKEYNVYDVLAEREIYEKLSKYEIPSFEREVYIADQIINDNGIFIDEELASSAIAVNIEYVDRLINKAKSITGLDNPKSQQQLTKWLTTETGDEITSLAKDTLPDLIKQYTNNATVSEILEIRQKISKSSVKKFSAMINGATDDNRVRGTFQFYGANRTGRWAGRQLQLQNLSKNHLDDIDTPRELVRRRDLELLEIVYDDVSDILSQLVRTAIIAPEGKILSVSDYSAIEARVISWLAEEEWRMDVFRGDGKIYEAAGSRMFNVPIESITKTSPIRQKSKIAELALGYQGSIGAMLRMGGDKMGLSEPEMKSIVTRWRKANPKIVEFWSEVESCAIEAVAHNKKVIGTPKNLVFDCSDDILTITLPSGRALFYRNPEIKIKKLGISTVRALYYQGQNQKNKQWELIDTYGGKLTENIVQGTARDLLAFAMVNLVKAGYFITMHIHDEVIVEIPDNDNSKNLYNDIIRIMTTNPSWATGLPLNADGYLTKYYKKD